MPVYHRTYTMHKYCLRCQVPGTCKCGKSDMKFRYSYKLRPPLSTKNKVKFRKFLDDCPIFVNCVPEELRSEFLNLLKEVKYYGKEINGQEWTKI